MTQEIIIDELSRRSLLKKEIKKENINAFINEELNIIQIILLYLILTQSYTALLYLISI